MYCAWDFFRRRNTNWDEKGDNGAACNIRLHWHISRSSCIAIVLRYELTDCMGLALCTSYNTFESRQML